MMLFTSVIAQTRHAACDSTHPVESATPPKCKRTLYFSVRQYKYLLTAYHTNYCADYLLPDVEHWVLGPADFKILRKDWCVNEYGRLNVLVKMINCFLSSVQANHKNLLFLRNHLASNKRNPLSGNCYPALAIQAPASNNYFSCWWTHIIVRTHNLSISSGILDQYDVSLFRFW